MRNDRRLGSPIVGVPRAVKRPATTQAAKIAPAPPRNESRGASGHADPGVRAAPAAARSTPPAPARPPAVQSLSLALPRQFDDKGLPGMCDRELSEADAKKELADLDVQFVKNCRKCRLCEARTQTVFGTGKARPELVFVGEGPGADEDREGFPFVGRAGQLLTRMIAAMTLTRDQVYIANIVKCRPPENRTPLDDEMTACAPYLFRQLAILRPKVIVALGRPSAQTLLATTTPIGKLRGEFHDFPPVPLQHLGLPKTKLMPTFHPAYLLRSPNEKSKAWEDLKQVMAFLGIAVPAK